MLVSFPTNVHELRSVMDIPSYGRCNALSCYLFILVDLCVFYVLRIIYVDLCELLVFTILLYSII